MSPRRAWLSPLVALAVAASAGRAAADTVIRFDELSIVPPRFVGLPGNHYQSLGVHFSFVDPLQNTILDSLWIVPAGHAGHGATSLPNSAPVWGGGLVMRVEFFDPADGSQATVDFVRAMVGDVSAEDDLVKLEAFGLAGDHLGQAEFLSTPSQPYGLVSVSATGIHRVELSEPNSGAGVDDFTFGPLTRLGVVAPSAGTLALATPHPQPLVAGAARVSFALPDASPATLEVYDVSGRLRGSREVGSLGPGRHTLAFTDAGELGAGLFFIRLRQGAHARTTRLVVAR